MVGVLLYFAHVNAAGADAVAVAVAVAVALAVALAVMADPNGATVDPSPHWIWIPTPVHPWEPPPMGQA